LSKKTSDQPPNPQNRSKTSKGFNGIN